MSKEKHIEIFYTDEHENKIDVNTIEGFSSVLNDLFSECKTENQCDCLYGNIEEMLKKSKRNRMLEITDI
ncbi:MAG: hypothetical protein HFH72_09285 [Lachnospiraceae bacterium]|nr:hypothetical protein [Lachnospiraceae bacterium]